MLSITSYAISKARLLDYINAFCKVECKVVLSYTVTKKNVISVTYKTVSGRKGCTFVSCKKFSIFTLKDMATRSKTVTSEDLVKYKTNVTHNFCQCESFGQQQYVVNGVTLCKHQVNQAKSLTHVQIDTIETLTNYILCQKSHHYTAQLTQ